MFKIKLLAGLFALVTSLVVFAAPAMAEFESTTGQSQGPIKTFPETTTFETVEGGPSLVCKSTNAEGKVVAEGGWQTQVKGLTQQGKFVYQNAALKGPHEQLKIEKWGLCTGPTGLPITVVCYIQVESSGTNPNGTLTIYRIICIFIIGTGENTCSITVQPDGNKELQGATLINSGTGVSISLIIRGLTSITQESKALCKTLGVKGSQKGGKLFTKNAFVTEGQKLV